DSIAGQHRTAHGHARDAAAGLIGCDAGNAVGRCDDAHDAHGHVARTAQCVDAVTGVEARRAIGDGDTDRGGASAAVAPQPVAVVVLYVDPVESDVCGDADGRHDPDTGRIADDRRVVNGQL